MISQSIDITLQGYVDGQTAHQPPVRWTDEYASHTSHYGGISGPGRGEHVGMRDAWYSWSNRNMNKKLEKDMVYWP